MDSKPKKILINVKTKKKNKLDWKNLVDNDLRAAIINDVKKIETNPDQINKLTHNIMYLDNMFELNKLQNKLEYVLSQSWVIPIVSDKKLVYMKKLLKKNKESIFIDNPQYIDNELINAEKSKKNFLDDTVYTNLMTPFKPTSSKQYRALELYSNQIRTGLRVVNIESYKKHIKKSNRKIISNENLKIVGFLMYTSKLNNTFLTPLKTFQYISEYLPVSSTKHDTKVMMFSKKTKEDKFIDKVYNYVKEINNEYNKSLQDRNKRIKDYILKLSENVDESDIIQFEFNSNYFTITSDSLQNKFIESVYGQYPYLKLDVDSQIQKFSWMFNQEDLGVTYFLIEYLYRLFSQDTHQFLSYLFDGSRNISNNKKEFLKMIDSSMKKGCKKNETCNLPYCKKHTQCEVTKVTNYREYILQLLELLYKNDILISNNKKFKLFNNNLKTLIKNNNFTRNVLDYWIKKTVGIARYNSLKKKSYRTQKNIIDLITSEEKIKIQKEKDREKLSNIDYSNNKCGHVKIENNYRTDINNTEKNRNGVILIDDWIKGNIQESKIKNNQLFCSVCGFRCMCMHEKLLIDKYYANTEEEKNKIDNELEINYFRNIVNNAEGSSKACRYCGKIVEGLNFEEQQFNTFGVQINNTEDNLVENYCTELLLIIERQDLDMNFIKEIIDKKLESRITGLKKDKKNFTNNYFTQIGLLKQKILILAYVSAAIIHLILLSDRKFVNNKIGQCKITQYDQKNLIQYMDCILKTKFNALYKQARQLKLSIQKPISLFTTELETLFNQFKKNIVKQKGLNIRDRYNLKFYDKLIDWKPTFNFKELEQSVNSGQNKIINTMSLKKLQSLRKNVNHYLWKQYDKIMGISLFSKDWHEYNTTLNMVENILTVIDMRLNSYKYNKIVHFYPYDYKNYYRQLDYNVSKSKLKEENLDKKIEYFSKACFDDTSHKFCFEVKENNELVTVLNFDRCLNCGVNINELDNPSKERKKLIEKYYKDVVKKPKISNLHVLKKQKSNDMEVKQSLNKEKLKNLTINLYKLNLKNFDKNSEEYTMLKMNSEQFVKKLYNYFLSLGNLTDSREDDMKELTQIDRYRKYSKKDIKNVYRKNSRNQILQYILDYKIQYYILYQSNELFLLNTSQSFQYLKQFIKEKNKFEVDINKVLSIEKIDTLNKLNLQKIEGKENEFVVRRNIFLNVLIDLVDKTLQNETNAQFILKWLDNTIEMESVLDFSLTKQRLFKATQEQKKRIKEDRFMKLTPLEKDLLGIYQGFDLETYALQEEQLKELIKKEEEELKVLEDGKMSVDFVSDRDNITFDGLDFNVDDLNLENE